MRCKLDSMPLIERHDQTMLRDDRYWAIFAGQLSIPIADGPLTGDSRGTGASERLKVVDCGTAALIGSLVECGRSSG
jgi:hypothetical protein